MCAKHGAVAPQANLTRLASLGKVDETLVGRTAEAQRDVLLGLDEGAVNEHVDAVEQRVCHALDVASAAWDKVSVVDVARVAPDILLGKLANDELAQREKLGLMLGLHGVPAQKRESPHIGGPKALDNLIGGLAREGQPVREVLRLAIEASRAVDAAARYEQGRPHAHAVGDIAVLDGSIVHRAWALLA